MHEMILHVGVARGGAVGASAIKILGAEFMRISCKCTPPPRGRECTPSKGNIHIFIGRRRVQRLI